MRSAVIGPLYLWLSARIVAAFRVTLAVVFILALLIDPAQPVRASDMAFSMLIAYLAFSILLALCAWTDWWLEVRLAWPALAVDIVVCAWTIYVTESASLDFATAYSAFFVFLLIEATFLAGWRTTLVVGLVSTAALAAVVGLLSWQGVEIDLVRIGRRIGFLLILTSLVVWYGGSRTKASVRGFVAIADPNSPAPLAEALDYAASLIRANQGVIAWRPQGEQSVVIRTLQDVPCSGTDAVELESYYLSDGAHAPSMFDLRRQVGLTLAADGSLIRHWQPGGLRLAAAVGARSGICLPLRSTAGRGTIVLWGLLAVTRDLLIIGQAISGEVAAAFDRHKLALMSFEDSIGRLRANIARDLHDSVAQSLAGASFRVEAARRTLREGGDADDELASIKDALQAEQRHIRMLIERLRRGREVVTRHDLGADLAALLPNIGRHWGIITGLECPATPIHVGTNQLHEIREITREAVANAARHGAARTVRIALHPEAGQLHLDIVDDGTGAARSKRAIRPRSIAERVSALGGTLETRHGPAGTRLYITVPRLAE